MTVKTRKFKTEDITRLCVQDPELALRMQITAEDGDMLEHFGGHTVTKGRDILMCCGILPVAGAHSGRAWALLPAESGPNMLPLTRIARGILARSPFRRIEITVVCGFEAGHRWARLLGFEQEAERMLCYDAAYRDHALYAMVKKAKVIPCRS